MYATTELVAARVTVPPATQQAKSNHNLPYCIAFNHVHMPGDVLHSVMGMQLLYQAGWLYRVFA